MIDALRFVKGAVSKQDLVPALTHFLIRNNTITGFNGQVALCAPIGLDLHLAPKASQLIKAVTACGDEVISLSADANGRLLVAAGSFQTYIECLPVEGYPDIQRSGRLVRVDNNFLPALKELRPFVGVDASRPWSCGILFDGQSAFTTNNIILCELWLGYDFPARINIPAFAVDELLRIGEPPKNLLISENTITFNYGNGAWMRSVLYVDQWPDVRELLDRHSGNTAVPVAKELFPALEQLAPFCDDEDRVFLWEDHISTSPVSDKDGTRIRLPGLGLRGCFNITQLKQLLNVVDEIDITAYPEPCFFIGHSQRSRGLIVGIRV